MDVLCMKAVVCYHLRIEDHSRIERPFLILRFGDCMRNTLICFFFLIVVFTTLACAEDSLYIGEYGLIANAKVQIKKSTAILTIKNDLENDIYVPNKYESFYIERPSGGIHGDGPEVHFPDDFEVLETGQTKQYHLKLTSVYENDKYLFVVWAPIRDKTKERKVLKKANVVYKIIGREPKEYKGGEVKWDDVKK